MPTVAAAAAAAAVNVVVSADRPVMVLLGDLIAPGDVVVFNEAWWQLESFELNWKKRRRKKKMKKQPLDCCIHSYSNN